MAGIFITEYSVTTRCQLACSYCYSRHLSGKSTTEMADKFFETIGDMMQVYNKDKYHVSFFGGEPLLNWDIITYMIPKLKEDPRCHSYTIISNCLELTEEKYKYLKDNNCGISMSFDGIWNNDSRPLANGKPSFNTYIEKKDLFKQLGGCKVMLSPNNFNTMTENFKFFVDEYEFNYPDFSLVRDDIYTDNDIEIFAKEIKRLADTIIEYNKKGKNCGTGLFNLYLLDSLIGKRYQKRTHGCFAGVGGALYSIDGKYYPCERFSANKESLLYDAVNNKWYHDEINKLKQNKLTNPVEFEECKKCEIYEYCNAGCTWSQIKYGEKHGLDRSKPVDHVCMLLKLSYKEAFRIYKELKDYNITFELKHRLKNSG